MPGGGMVWFNDPVNIADLLRYMRDETLQAEGLDDALEVLDNPRKFSIEYAAMRAIEGRVAA